MKFSAATFLGLGLAGLSAAQNVIPMSFTKKSSANQGTGVQNINNLQFQYMAEVAVGTPPQMLTLLIDTGSADTWMFSDLAGNQCDSPSLNFCPEVFFPEESTTYREINDE